MNGHDPVTNHARVSHMTLDIRDHQTLLGDTPASEGTAP